LQTIKSNNHALELYSRREEAIRYFEPNHPEDFDSYGQFWSKQEYPSYCGPIDRKKAILEKHMFSICYEDSRALAFFGVGRTPHAEEGGSGGWVDGKMRGSWAHPAAAGAVSIPQTPVRCRNGGTDRPPKVDDRLDGLHGGS
jgi:hypothetical protein